jgi:L-threonylcarbamoyladenylate synthase
MIETTVDALLQKKLILYPTDTVWGIGGDATDSKVVQKVYRLKTAGRPQGLDCSRSL